MDDLTDFLNLDRFTFSFSNVNLKHKYNKKITYEYTKPDYATIIGDYERKIYDEFKNYKKLINGVWFYGLSGSGKTTSSKYLKKNIFKNALILDGDLIRKYISIDLGYDIKDRLIQLRRIVGLCKICIDSGIFPICSTVYMNKKAINDL